MQEEKTVAKGHLLVYQLLIRLSACPENIPQSAVMSKIEYYFSTSKQIYNPLKSGESANRSILGIQRKFKQFQDRLITVNGKFDVIF